MRNISSAFPIRDRQFTSPVTVAAMNIPPRAVPDTEKALDKLLVERMKE